MHGVCLHGGIHKELMFSSMNLPQLVFERYVKLKTIHKVINIIWIHVINDYKN